MDRKAEALEVFSGDIDKEEAVCTWLSVHAITSSLGKGNLSKLFNERHGRLVGEGNSGATGRLKPRPTHQWCPVMYCIAPGRWMRQSIV